MNRKFWKHLRQTSQLICLFVFLLLFRLTEYTGSDQIPWAVNIWFRMDPLAGVCVALASCLENLLSLFWPCLVILVLTLILGRFFCAWICPMGSLIDIFGRFARPKYSPMSMAGWRFIKYGILIIVLVSSCFSMQLLGFFDPFALLVRAMTFSLDPAFNYLMTSGFDWVYVSGPEWMSEVTEPVYDLLKVYILPHKQSVFMLSFVSFFLLAAIFCMEFAGKRFWCRNICPLGALLGLVARFSFLRRLPIRSCKGCELCNTKCPMAPFDGEGKFMAQECHLCMNCLDYCPEGAAGFKWRGSKGSGTMVDINRRKVLAAGVLGVCLPVLSRTHADTRFPDNDNIRPPGALDEADFLALCLRCGECMKVCITQGLQPLGLDRGIETMFTPVLVPRIGYCEFNCTLCSSVCPTHAIALLPKKEKQVYVMGKAFFDKNRCLPWAENKGCIVCEEHCPVHDKAIKFDVVQKIDARGRSVKVKQPHVVSERCIGCGICEHVCPVPGQAAVRVVGRDSRRESRGDNFMPPPGSSGDYGSAGYG